MKFNVIIALWVLSFQVIHLQAQNPKREFRGVWIATVNNIDWPSRPGLPVEEQKEELTDLLDELLDLGMNAVIFQVRPAGDALYFSPFEPWSEYLTGVQGKSPDPFFDPLQFIIEACHDRGMELHAWVNPFRAYVSLSKRRYIDPSHILSKHPEWVVTYGDRAYLDPGLPDAREYVLQVILDLLYRYDIDGLHIDDYFYPYKIQGKEFPDSLSYRRYGKSFVPKADWRRENINSFVRSLRNHSQAIKPWVKFGISPFGVWRNASKDPRGSQTRAGTTSYDDLYADVRGWLERGWIDYVAPQLYWSIGFAPASYDVLVEWWSNNSFGKDLYIGKAAYKVGNNSDKNWDNPEELAKQVALDRRNGGPDGSIYFSAKSLLKNPLNALEPLRSDVYTSKALLPSGPWGGISGQNYPKLFKYPLTLGELSFPGKRGKVHMWVFIDLGKRIKSIWKIPVFCKRW